MPWPKELVARSTLVHAGSSGVRMFAGLSPGSGTPSLLAEAKAARYL